MVQDALCTDTFPRSQGNERWMAVLVDAFLRPWKLVESSWGSWEAVGNGDGHTKNGTVTIYI